jgi:hypothetical protein
VDLWDHDQDYFLVDQVEHLDEQDVLGEGEIALCLYRS